MNLEEVLDGIVKGIREATRRALIAMDAKNKSALDQRDAAISALQKRVAELEAGSLRYEGVWQEGKVYKRGVFVTWGGSVWHANCETTGKPGQCADFSLAVKAGRDGKDAR